MHGECVIMHFTFTAFHAGSRHVKYVLLTIEIGSFKSMVANCTIVFLQFIFECILIDFHWAWTTLLKIAHQITQELLKKRNLG